MFLYHVDMPLFYNLWISHISHALTFQGERLRLMHPCVSISFLLRWDKTVMFCRMMMEKLQGNSLFGIWKHKCIVHTPDEFCNITRVTSVPLRLYIARLSVVFACCSVIVCFCNLSHLMGMFYRTIRMLESGIKPVYVFDGKPPQLKSGEVSFLYLVP